MQASNPEPRTPHHQPCIYLLLWTSALLSPAHPWIAWQDVEVPPALVLGDGTVQGLMQGSLVAPEVHTAW